MNHPINSLITLTRSIAPLVLIGAVAQTSLQAAETGPYFRLENGVNSISGANFNLGPNTVRLLKEYKYDASPSMKLKFKEAYTYGGAIGYRFTESFSTEIELDHAENEIKSLDGYSIKNTIIGHLGLSNPQFKQTNLLFSAIYHHRLSEMLTFNLGAGAGAQFCSTNSKSVSAELGDLYLSTKPKSDTSFVAQLKTGLSFDLSKNLSLDVSYKIRFASSSDVYHGTELESKITEKVSLDNRLNHAFTAGFTYSF